MENQKQSRRLPLGLIAGISVAILAVGGGAAWWAKHSMTNATKSSTPANTAPSETVTSDKPPQAQQPAREEQVELYWLSANASSPISLARSTISVPQTSNQQELLASAFQSLLDGPKPDRDKDYTTTIPQGTKLLDLKLDQQGIHVNLSKEFASGGGSTSMTGRVAQIIYTATSLDNNAKVWINVEGKPLEAPLGGEGLILEQPTTRQDFKNNFEL